MLLLERKRIGLLIRVFSSKPELVSVNVENVKLAVLQALVLSIDDKQVFSRIDILVSADPRFGDCDCGETAVALRNMISDLRVDLTDYPYTTKVEVHEVTKGDIYCGLLNYGVAVQLRHRVDYTMVLSSEVASYLNSETVRAMVVAHEEGARVTGVALNELTDSILQGRIANTFAMWDIVSLMTVGGFDLKAAKPLKDSSWRSPEYRGWAKPLEESVENGAYKYNLAGVEEIIPLIRMGFLFGQCIAPILPQGDNVKRWVAPNPATDPAGFQRHNNKMNTKQQRQEKMASGEFVDLNFISDHLIPKYRTF